MSSRKPRKVDKKAKPKKVEKTEEEIKPQEPRRQLRPLSSIKIRDIKPAYMIYEQMGEDIQEAGPSSDNVSEGPPSAVSLLITEFDARDIISEDKLSLPSLTDSNSESLYSLSEGPASTASIPDTATDGSSTENSSSILDSEYVSVGPSDNRTEPQASSSQFSMPETEHSSQGSPEEQMDDEALGQMALEEIKAELEANPDAIEFVTAVFEKLIAESLANEEESDQCLNEVMEEGSEESVDVAQEDKDVSGKKRK